MTSPGLYQFEALAEIFDFVAGLVQRVPKKPNEMKADLQNSTASQGDCLPFGFLNSAHPTELYPHSNPKNKKSTIKVLIYPLENPI